MQDKFSKEEAIKSLQENEYAAKLVQYFEQSDNPNLRTGVNVNGSTAHITLTGYVTLIKSFIAQSEADHKELKEFCEQLEANLDLTNDRVKFAEKIYNDLEDKGYAYTNYSSHSGGHANFLKFFKKDNKYYCTLYNAGAYINGEQKNFATGELNNRKKAEDQ